MTSIVAVSIYDNKASIFQNPLFVPAVGVAVRLFGDEINRAADDNLLYRHPTDFDLYELGYFDSSNGQFTPLDKPALIITGLAAKTD